MNVLSEEDGKRNIAANLRRMMANRGWNQMDLARATGDDQNAIWRVLNGKNVPRATLLARIAEALETSVDKLLSTPPATTAKKSA